MAFLSINAHGYIEGVHESVKVELHHNGSYGTKSINVQRPFEVMKF